jgi:hypothetical protein
VVFEAFDVAGNRLVNGCRQSEMPRRDVDLHSESRLPLPLPTGNPRAHGASTHRNLRHKLL